MKDFWKDADIRVLIIMMLSLFLLFFLALVLATYLSIRETNSAQEELIIPFLGLIDTTRNFTS
jgi:CHASE3 domain sensor protein